jgi:hypothetical protein
LKILLALAVALPAAALAPAGTAGAATDPIVTACLAKPKATASGCACQAKLARVSFNRQERSLAVLGLSGRRDAFLAGLAKLKDTQRQSFVGKMLTLQRRAAAECR